MESILPTQETEQDSPQTKVVTLELTEGLSRKYIEKLEKTLAPIGGYVHFKYCPICPPVNYRLNWYKDITQDCNTVKTYTISQSIMIRLFVEDNKVSHSIVK